METSFFFNFDSAPFRAGDQKYEYEEGECKTKAIDYNAGNDLETCRVDTHLTAPSFIVNGSALRA
jgi:hypothetical protein